MSRTHKLGYVYATLAVLIWTGFILVSRMGGISPLLANDVIAIRYATCAVILLPLWLFKFRFNLLDPKLIACGVLGGLIYALCAFRGFELAPASHAAVLLPGLMPLMIIVMASAINGERRHLGSWLGVAIISAGVGSLMWQQLASDHAISEGHLWLVGAALCWALYSVLVKRWGISPWQATVSLALVTACLYLPVYLLWLPKNLSLSSWQTLWPDILLQAFYQGIMATIVQMLLYVKAVQTIGPSAMGSMMAIVPVLAGLSAIVLFQEAFQIELLIGLVLVSVGAWLANTPSPQRKRSTVCPT